MQADVRVASLSGTSYRWIDQAINARTQLIGFTWGAHQTNSVASAVIQNNGASVYISGHATITYGVPTPWGSLDYMTVPVSCSTTYRVY